MGNPISTTLISAHYSFQAFSLLPHRNDKSWKHVRDGLEARNKDRTNHTNLIYLLNYISYLIYLRCTDEQNSYGHSYWKAKNKATSGFIFELCRKWKWEKERENVLASRCCKGTRNIEFVPPVMSWPHISFFLTIPEVFLSSWFYHYIFPFLFLFWSRIQPSLRGCFLGHILLVCIEIFLVDNQRVLQMTLSYSSYNSNPSEVEFLWLIHVILRNSSNKQDFLILIPEVNGIKIPWGSASSVPPRALNPNFIAVLYFESSWEQLRIWASIFTHPNLSLNLASSNNLSLLFSALASSRCPHTLLQCLLII